MDDFDAMNEVYEKVCKRIYLHNRVVDLEDLDLSQLIPTPKPARTCIQAGKLPFDADIGIEAIAST